MKMKAPARESRGFWGACAHWIGGVWGGECLSNCLLERGVIPIVPSFINGKQSGVLCEASAGLYREEDMGTCGMTSLGQCSPAQRSGRKLHNSAANSSS